MQSTIPYPLRRRLGCFTVFLMVPAGLSLASSTIRIDDLIGEAGGAAKISAATVQATTEQALRSLQTGDALVLPSRYDLGTVRLSGLAPGVQILGGRNGTLVLDGPVERTVFFGQHNVSYVSGPALGKTGRGQTRLADSWFLNGIGAVELTGDVRNTYWINHSLDTVHFLGSHPAKQGFRYFSIDGTMSECATVYLRYNNEMDKSGRPSMHFSLHGTGRNVKLFQLIEHNQTNGSPAVVLDDVVGMQLVNGSTESSNYQGAAVYQLNRCTGVYLGPRRLFSSHSPGSWYGNPLLSLYVSGTGNILDNVLEMQNPNWISFMCEDPSIQIWSSSFEDEMWSKGPVLNRFIAFLTPESMTSEIDMWTEPPQVNKEIILQLQTAGGILNFTNPDSLPGVASLPAPPSLPVCDVPPPPGLLYKQAHGFGSALLAAGADPTGVRTSDQAFQQLLVENDIVEVPRGRFRLSAPIDMNRITRERVARNRGRLWVCGAGPEATSIVGAPGKAVFHWPASLSKELADSMIVPVWSYYDELYSDLTIEGGAYGFFLRSGSRFDKICYNIVFRGQDTAGAWIESRTETGNTTLGEHEQNRFVSCRFENTGNYGVRMLGYSDKYLFFHCRFSGQKRGGIYCTDIVHFHSGVWQCTFENIGGPGLRLIGGNTKLGYGPWVLSVDSCVFTECGSDTEAVVDLGYSYVSHLSNSRIVTQTKAVHAAFKGCFAVIDNVTMDCKLTDSVAMYLGHQRFEKTCRNQGSRVTRVRASGAVSFLDYATYVTGKYAILGSFNYSGPEWWKPGGGYPWRYPYIFYQVENTTGRPLLPLSDNPSIEYALINDETIIDLSPYTTRTDRSAGAAPPRLPRDSRSVKVCDLLGRTVPNADIAMPGAARCRGVRIARLPDGRAVKRLAVVR